MTDLAREILQQFALYVRTDSYLLKRWSGPWQNGRESEIIDAAKRGYPSYDFVTVPRVRLKTETVLGTIGFIECDDTAALVDLETPAAS